MTPVPLVSEPCEAAWLNLKVPDCLRDVDAKLRSALGLLQDGYSKAQKGLVAWMPVGQVMPVQDMDVMYSGMRDIEIGDQKLNEASPSYARERLV